MKKIYSDCNTLITSNPEAWNINLYLKKQCERISVTGIVKNAYKFCVVINNENYSYVKEPNKSFIK